MSVFSSSTSPSVALPPALRAFVATLRERRARTAADRSLARRIQSAVRMANLETGGFSFYVHDGSVAVYGSVATEALREQILGIVAEQPGLRRITDHLQRTPA